MEEFTRLYKSETSQGVKLHFVICVSAGVCLFLAGVGLNRIANHDFAVLDISCAAFDYDNCGYRHEYVYKLDDVQDLGCSAFTITPHEHCWQLTLECTYNGSGRKVKCFIDRETCGIIKLWDCRIRSLDFAVMELESIDGFLSLTENTTYAHTRTRIPCATNDIYYPVFLPFLCSNINRKELPISICVFQPELKRVIRYNIRRLGPEPDLLLFASEYLNIRAQYKQDRNRGRCLPVAIEYFYPNSRGCFNLKCSRKITSEDAALLCDS